MGKAYKHALTNISGVGGVISFCVGEWAADWLQNKQIDVSWGWLALVLVAVWVGAQVRQLENGDHRIQTWLARRRSRVDWGAPRYVNTADGGYEIYADVNFLRHAQNVVIKVEVFKHVITLSNPIWQRVASHDQICRVECNTGHTEEVKLIQVLSEPAAPPFQSAFSPAPPPVLMKNQGQGFFKVKVRVTGTGMHFNEKEFDLWWQDGKLNALPLVARSAEFRGDAEGMIREGFTLWKTK